MRRLLSGAMFLAGCSGPAADFCEKFVKCVGGNDADTEACEADTDGMLAAAEAYGCDEQGDALIECYVDKGECIDDPNHDGEKVFTTADDGNDACETERENYNQCVDGASAIGDGE